MMSQRRFSFGRFALVGAIAAIPGLVPAQHVHGVIEIGVVLEENTLAVSVHAPLSDVVGFEHAAENDQQAERLREAAALLQHADRMFGVPESARCTLQELTVDAPEYLRLAAKDSDEQRDQHADHDSHDEDSDGHSHSDVDAQYVWECAAPAEIKELEARFVQGFENIETVKIQVITPSGMHVADGDSRLEVIGIFGP